MSRSFFRSDPPAEGVPQELTDYKVQAEQLNASVKKTKSYYTGLWSRIWELQNDLNTMTRAEAARPLTSCEKKVKAGIIKTIESKYAVLKETDFEKLIEERENQAEAVNRMG